MTLTHVSDVTAELAASMAEYFRLPFLVILDIVETIARLVQESKIYNATFNVENATFLLLISGIVFGENAINNLSFYGSTDHILTALIGFFNQLFDTKYDIGMLAFFDHKSPRKLARWVAQVSRFLTQTNVALLATAFTLMVTFFKRVIKSNFILVYPGSLVQNSWIKVIVKPGNQWEVANQLQLSNASSNFVFTVTQKTNVADKIVIVGKLNTKLLNTTFIGGFFTLESAKDLFNISS